MNWERSNVRQDRPGGSGHIHAAGAALADRIEGSITKPSNGKTYSGSATLSGNSLKLKGCVFGGLICESQNWSRL
jgi:hypothetical protein